MALKIAINGMGHIGRNILREALRRDIEIVALNDIARWDVILHLLEFDSTHGKFDVKYKITGNTLELEYKNKFQSIILNNALSEINFGNADIIIESSGQNLSKKAIRSIINTTKSKVIISANAIDDTKTLVMGVNEKEYNNERIVSNASCTTNCIAPICDILDRYFKINAGMLTTIHSFTNNQSLLDNAKTNDLRRARAASVNIIPTTTGAAIGIKKVLPNLESKLHGQSVRVPVIDVSMADLNIYLDKDFDLDEVKEIFIRESKNRYKNILGIDTRYMVSSDVLGSPLSAVVPLDLMIKVNNMIKVMAWYDNEIGYSNRILDLASYIA